MQPITYSLLTGSGSEGYYREVRLFARTVMREAGLRLGPLADGFAACSQGAPQSRSETLLDALVIGTLWCAHGPEASRVNPWWGRLLAGIASLRRRGGFTKNVVDAFRGVVNTLFLLQRPSDAGESLSLDLDGLDRLIAWLQATAEYRREAERLCAWRDWLATRPERERTDCLRSLVRFGAWFEERSAAALGAYTSRVPVFLATQLTSHRWNEDIISVGRPRVEYHLAMVGAEVMNQAFRGEFLECSRRVLLVPGCMRASASDCRAEATRRGHLCTGCTGGCRVDVLRRSGLVHGYEVVILHHASDLSVWKPKPGEERAGIIGVACMSALLGGGWELRSLGIAAQCVPLDGCGCRSHWDPKGRVTSLSSAELKRVLSAEVTLVAPGELVRPRAARAA